MVAQNDRERPLSLQVQEIIKNKCWPCISHICMDWHRLTLSILDELISFMTWGSSGQVWKARVRGTDSYSAIKVMRDPGFSAKASRAREAARIIFAAGSDCIE